MRDPNPVLTLMLGMSITLVILALLLVIGPGIVPSQLDQCWVELQKQQPKCSTRQQNGITFIKESRCIRAEKGIQMTALDDSGWYQISKLPAPAPPTGTGQSRTRPGVPPEPNE